MIWASKIHKSWKKYEVHAVEHQAELMYIYFGLEDVEIELRLKKDNPNFFGFCERESNKHMVITIHHCDKLTEMLCTVIHEMTHAKQFAFKELKDDNTWKGSKRWQKVKYENQPWEIEAHKMERLFSR